MAFFILEAPIGSIHTLDFVPTIILFIGVTSSGMYWNGVWV
jgi:hypothetical protein